MTTTAHPLPRTRGVLGWLGQVLAWVVILGVAALLAVAVVVPRVTGSTPYVVLTSSMEPRLPPGTLVVTRPTDPDAVGTGDVVTYQLRSGEPTVVTHRVVGVGVDSTGERRLTTQGDANDAPDAETVRDVQVRGVVWYAVPHLGRVTSLVSHQQRRLLTWAVAGGLVLYAAGMFVGAARDRRAAATTRPGRRRATRRPAPTGGTS